MRRTPRSLANGRKELVQIEQEFVRLQRRIETVRHYVADSLVRLFGDERPAFVGLHEEAFIERVAGRVVARLKQQPNAQVQGESRYVRIDGCIPRGQRLHTSKLAEQREASSPPFVKVGGMVMYSMKGLEQFMEERSVEGQQVKCVQRSEDETRHRRQLSHIPDVCSREPCQELESERWRSTRFSVANLGVITLAIEFAKNKLCG